MARKKRVLLAKKREKMEAKKLQKQKKISGIVKQPQVAKPQLTPLMVERQEIVRKKMFAAAANIAEQVKGLDNETKMFLQEQGTIGIKFPTIDYNDEKSFNKAIANLEAQAKPDYIDRQIYETKRFLADVAVGKLSEDNAEVLALQEEAFDLIVDATPEQLRKINKAYSMKDLADYYDETDENSSLYEEEELVARLEQIIRFLK